MLGSTWSGSANRLQNWRATRPRPRLWGSRPSSGRIRRTIGCQSRLTKATAGGEQRQAGDALGRAQPHLDGDAAAHRVADQVGAADVEGVHHLDDGVGEPARRVRAGDGLGGAAEARQVERVDAVARARERGRGVEERGLGRAQAVDADDVGAVAHRQRRDPAAGERARRGCAAAAGARWAGGTCPRSRWPGRRRRGRRAGAARRPRRPTARLRAGPARSAASVPMTTSGSRRVQPLRTRAPWVVQRTSHVRPTSPRRTW